MVCYRRNEDGSYTATRKAVLSEEIVNEVAARIDKDFTQQKSNRQRAESAASSAALNETRTSPEADRQAERARQQAEAARQAERARQQAEAARRAERARQQAEEERRAYEELQRKLRRQEEAAKRAREEREARRMREDLERLRRQLEQRERSLRSKEREANRQSARQQELERSLRAKNDRLRSKERQLDEQQRQQEEDERRRNREAENLVAGLEAGFEAAHGKEMKRWQEQAYQQARKAIGEAKKALRSGDLPTVHLIAKRARAELEELEESAFEGERLEQERARSAKILVRALEFSGHQIKRVKMRDKADPRSPVDIVSSLPSGTGVIFTLRHDRTFEIRPQNASGHEECHSIEDSLKAAAEPLGLRLMRGQKVTTRTRRKAVPAIRVAGKARRITSD